MATACRKCHGFMVEDRMTDQRTIAHVYRCVNCGEVVDAVIQSHRERQAAGEQFVIPDGRHGKGGRYDWEQNKLLKQGKVHHHG